MTTENLEGIDAIIASQATMADQWRQRAADLLRDREQLDADSAAALANAQMIARGIQQKFTDAAVPLDEEISQVVNIVNGPRVSVEPEAPAPEPVAPVEPPAPAVVPTPEPIAPAPAPEPEPEPTPEPPAPAATTAQTATVVAQEQNPNVFVSFTRWVRGWRLIEWILALLLAYIAYRVSGDHQSWGFRSGFWSNAQHFLWRSGWTLIGFTVGGLIGTYIARPFGQTVVTTYRTNRTATPV